MDYALYRQVFRRILVTNLVDHHCIPSIHQKSYDLVCDGEFQLVVPPTHPNNYSFGLYGVLVVGKEQRDLAEMLIKRKQDWNRKLKKLEKNVDRDDFMALKSVRKGKNGNISLGLRQYLEHMKNDPVNGYEQGRNLLYTGGTVKTMTDENGSALVYCSGRGLSEISVMPFTQNEDGSPAAIKLKMDQPVLQLDVDPSNSLLCVRQKNNITVLKRDGPNFKVAAKKKIRKSRFFASCAIKNELVALSKNMGKLALFDVNVNRLSFVQKIGESRLDACPDGKAWSQLHWLDRQLLVVRNKSLTTLDPRSGKINWDLRESLNDCEDICNFIKSDGSGGNTGFVATSHNLFELDLRQQKFLQKWAHTMKYEPSFGQAAICDNEEVVVLQSSNASEAVIVGSGHPRLMSGITDGLRDAQLHGICLDPDVSKRVRYNVTGTHILTSGDSMKQVTQNAGGDIYLRDICANTATAEDEESDQLRRGSWRELEEAAPVATDAYYSEILSMTRALESIQLPRDGDTSQAEMYWPRGKRFVPERLHEFRDNMAEPLLEVWNVVPAVDENAMDDEEVSGVTKVEAWLQHHSVFEE